MKFLAKIKDIGARAFRFWVGIFLDQDKTPSFCRCAGGVLVATWIVLAVHAWGIPERTSDFGIMLVALYTANSARNAVQSFAALKKEHDETPPAS